jgi:hypothetical protein
VSIDAALGRLGNKSGVCTSSTRPTNPFEGQLIYETDTNRTLVYDNAAWLVVADNQVLSIDSTNSRIGIGTTAPNQELDVNGSIATTGGTTNNRGILLAHQNNINYSYVGRSEGGVADTGNRLGWDYDNDNFDIKTGGDTRLTIDSSGNVGINDATPSYKLDVNGDINATDNLRIGGTAIGEWTAFTPTLANCTTTSVDAVYAKINKVVHVNCRLNIASVTGIVVITMPSNMSKIVIGNAEMSDANAAASYAGAALQWSTNQIFLRPFQTGGTYATWNANQNTTVPFTWASGDVIRVVLTYVEA